MWVYRNKVQSRNFSEAQASSVLRWEIFFTPHEQSLAIVQTVRCTGASQVDTENHHVQNRLCLPTKNLKSSKIQIWRDATSTKFYTWPNNLSTQEKRSIHLPLARVDKVYYKSQIHFMFSDVSYTLFYCVVQLCYSAFSNVMKMMWQLWSFWMFLQSHRV